MKPFARLAVAAMIFGGVASPTLCKTTWTAAGRPYLEGRPSAEESDATVRASCAFEGIVSLRLGADIGVGAGKGEQVSVKIESGGKSARIQGHSRSSPDAEMTGGTELAADLPLNDPALEILFSGKAVTLVTPDQKKHPLVEADGAGATKKFLKQCRGE